jgi:transcriptional regulator with PAS, ATPase and Fis domain
MKTQLEMKVKFERLKSSLPTPTQPHSYNASSLSTTSALTTPSFNNNNDNNNSYTNNSYTPNISSSITNNSRISNHHHPLTKFNKNYPFNQRATSSSRPEQFQNQIDMIRNSRPNTSNTPSSSWNMHNLGGSPALTSTLDKLSIKYKSSNTKKINNALIFTKPNSITNGSRYIITSSFDANKIRTITKGKIIGKEIQEIFYKQYGEIKYFAENNPSTYTLTMKQKSIFKENYSISWEEVIKEQIIFSCDEACALLEINYNDLYLIWKQEKVGNNTIF